MVEKAFDGTHDHNAAYDMVEKALDGSAFPLNLPLQSDANPLGKLMEQYHKLAASESKTVQERVDAVKPPKTALTTSDGGYSQYAPYWSTAGTNWWDAANWPALSYGAEGYNPYLANQLNILSAAGVPGAAAAATSSGLALPCSAPSEVFSSLTQRINRISPTSVSSPGGGKYNRGNCECPNCMEAERIGLNNMPPKKRGIHNCHIRGCGKLYNKSSHLKAHLRWHNSERIQKPRRSGDVV